MRFKLECYELQELMKIKYGKNQKKVEDENGEFPILGTGGVMGYANKFLYDKPSVLIGRKGSISKVKYIDKPFWTVDTLFYTEINENKALPLYIYYYLSQIDFNYYNEGTTIPSLRTETLNKIEIYLPNIKVQNKIVDFFSNIDKKIELNTKIISNLEQLSQTFFKHWFIDFEFPNEEGKPYKSSGGEMVESELGEIPKKWCSKKFNSIMKISSGKRPKIKADNYSLENSIPIIGASKLMGYTREMLFDSPILVIGRVGTHGVVQKIVDRCWPSDNTLVIQSEFYNFVYEFLKVIDYKSLNRGSTQPLITQTDIKNQTIIVPEDLTIMKKFEEILMPLLNKQFLLLKENESLTQIRDTLLPKLLSGEIEIPDNLEV